VNLVGKVGNLIKALDTKMRRSSKSTCRGEWTGYSGRSASACGGTGVHARKSSACHPWQCIEAIVQLNDIDITKKKGYSFTSTTVLRACEKVNLCHLGSVNPVYNPSFFSLFFQLE
jgi:hypothetical protein